MAAGAQFPSDSFLGQLPPSAIATLEARGRRRAYPKGATLFYEGDDGHDVVAVVAGLVKVSIVAESGREVILDVLGPGALLGELSAIDAGPRSATAVALHAVDAIVLTHDRFEVLMQEEPMLPAALLNVVAARLRDASRRQFEFGTADALGRLCASLAELDERYGRDDAGTRLLELPFAQGELAAHAGLSREAVVKSLAALRNLEWLTVDRRTVRIVDLGALRARAGR